MSPVEPLLHVEVVTETARVEIVDDPAVVQVEVLDEGALVVEIPVGLPGSPEAPGEDGEDGVTPALSVAATTLPPDAEATATITGPPEAPLVTFGIPKGEPGDSSTIPEGVLTEAAWGPSWHVGPDTPQFFGAPNPNPALRDYGLLVGYDLPADRPVVSGAAMGYPYANATIICALYGGTYFKVPTLGQIYGPADFSQDPSGSFDYADVLPVPKSGASGAAPGTPRSGKGVLYAQIIGVPIAESLSLDGIVLSIMRLGMLPTLAAPPPPPLFGLNDLRAGGAASIQYPAIDPGVLLGNSGVVIDPNGATNASGSIILGPSNAEAPPAGFNASNLLIGRYLTADGQTTSGLAIGSSSQVRNQGIAIGTSSYADQNTVSIGIGANGNGWSNQAQAAVAVGRGAAARQTNAVALGADSTANVQGGVGLGQNSAPQRPHTVGFPRPALGGPNAGVFSIEGSTTPIAGAQLTWQANTTALFVLDLLLGAGATAVVGKLTAAVTFSGTGVPTIQQQAWTQVAPATPVTTPPSLKVASNLCYLDRGSSSSVRGIVHVVN